MTRTAVLVLIATLVVAVSAVAQETPSNLEPGAMMRDEAQHATVRAIHVPEPLRVDGRLDEDVYRLTSPISDFIQTLPRNNAEPTERTEAWVMFDSTYLYIAARCRDSASPDKWIANEMRRDNNQLRQNDHFGVMLDTFHDRRNGYVFYANPLGGRSDQIVSDEGNPNLDWNPVWQAKTGRFDGGWTIEMAIPFKSLRYVSGTNQTWGIQIRRSIRRKNEWIHLNPLPLTLGGPQGFFRISAAATLVGLDLPEASRNIELKPYGISRATTDHVARPLDPNDVNGDFGIDARYGLTANLTADFTYNTDFAQVEIDEQQINLTRFSLFFPEKRDFFLEGRGFFNFATPPTTGGGGGGGGGSSGQGPNSATPTLFYSRRIGLNLGREIPIDVGARMTGKLGRFGLGALNVQSGDEPLSRTPATNFTVLRVKRDILRRSSVGLVFTNRSRAETAAGSNQAYGSDATFSFRDDTTFGGYYARTHTPGLRGDDESYQARFDFSPDRYGARFEYLKVGEHFNPEVGFVSRDDFTRSFGSIRYSPRPKNIRGIRQFTWEANIEYFENGAGRLETRQRNARFNVERENSDQFVIEGATRYEVLVLPFAVARDVTVAAGGYSFNGAAVRYSFGQQRRVSGAVSLERGGFYDGTITALSYTGARVAVTKRLSVEPTISINRVELPAGDFTTELLRARTDYGFTPLMFASALLQYSSADSSFSSNLRFRWEYHPGSELFVVYTDERDTIAQGFPGLKNRAFVIKINRLFRF
jgi:uncharacterized protein DUF5916